VTISRGFAEVWAQETHRGSVNASYPPEGLFRISQSLARSTIIGSISRLSRMERSAIFQMVDYSKANAEIEMPMKHRPCTEHRAN
jgi:hypothetical protein